MLSPTPPGQRPLADPAGQYHEGTLSVRVAVCRSIDDILARYRLPGPAVRSFTPPFDPVALAVGLDRHYRVAVAPGVEHTLVEELSRQTQDFDHVQLVYAANLCVVSCPPSPRASVEPAAGPRGTEFRLQFCCWPAGTAVEKIFTTPDGRVIRIADTSRADSTVVAGWGSGPSDPLGSYVVRVRGNGLAQILRFRIE
jgi:hypothetical protein